jgi:general secretion pathway protein F
MATYYYKASTAAGEWKEGSAAGDNERAVAARLSTQGLFPVYVGLTPPESQAAASGLFAFRLGGRGTGKSGKKNRLPFLSRSLAQDRLEFTQEFSTLLGSGIPVDRALQIVSQLAGTERFRMVISGILRELRGGKSLAEAMEMHGDVFSRLYVNMVRAGQASGSLPEVFARLSDFETRDAEFRSHIISSMIYPVLLTLVALASMVVMMYFVVPRFGEVFATSGIPVPASTAVLLWMGNTLRQYGLLVLLGVVGGTFAFRQWAISPAGRASLDKLLLDAPLLGDMLRKAETARFARTMSTMVGHGVPIVESLRIVRETVNNTTMANAFDGIIQGVKRGEGVALPIERAKVFPELAVHLMRVGEETGRLDTMFERLANVYDAETRTTLRRITALFEPAVILLMGITIGAIVLSLLMAISSINEIPF